VHIQGTFQETATAQIVGGQHCVGGGDNRVTGLVTEVGVRIVLCWLFIEDITQDVFGQKWRILIDGAINVHVKLMLYFVVTHWFKWRCQVISTMIRMLCHDAFHGCVLYWIRVWYHYAWFTTVLSDRSAFQVRILWEVIILTQWHVLSLVVVVMTMQWCLMHLVSIVQVFFTEHGTQVVSW
jgi:hypothetical protein